MRKRDAAFTVAGLLLLIPLLSWLAAGSFWPSAESVPPVAAPLHEASESEEEPPAKLSAVKESAPANPDEPKVFKVVIDPGHGGM